jgi:hypothetical protein
MLRKTVIAAVAILSAMPALARNTQIPPGQFPSSSAPQAQTVLRLMNDREFSSFLEHLDADLQRSRQQLKKMDVELLSRDAQEQKELLTSYNRCLQSVDSTRDEIQKLAQKQTLKLDLFLLIDLNELARNLDSFDEILVNPVAVNGTAGAQKTLAYARQILSIDGALGTQISTFQHHFIAFAGMVDASIEQNDADAAPLQNEKQ